MMRITVLSAIVGLFLTGCSSTPTTTVASTETQRKAKELQESIKKDAQKKLDEMDSQMKAWKVKVDNATGDAKVAMEKRYNELKVQRDKFADQVNEFGKASGDAWEKLKDGLAKATTDISDAFKKAADEFK